jgi:3-dehydroquinate dehydratase
MANIFNRKKKRIEVLEIRVDRLNKELDQIYTLIKMQNETQDNIVRILEKITANK